MKHLRRLAVQNMVLIFSANRATKLSKSRTHKIRDVQKPFPSDWEEKRRYFIRFSKANGFPYLEIVFSRMIVIHKGLQTFTVKAIGVANVFTQ